MAFLAGPAVLALVGGIIAPGAAFSTLGAAIGWTVGAWLFGPQASTGNQIFDPGAEELPRINQALRGATIPIFFGTNRVSSQIVWTNNFTTIRKESTTGSGGKAGGSGGKAPQGPTNVSYEYKWDMMFHLGISPTPVSLYGGWMNSKKLTPETIQAILLGNGQETVISNPDEEGADASLSFEDSYFGAANPTGSQAQLPWDVLTSAMGAEFRYPYSAYVGFDQLYLGGTPNVPQLSWEVGPGLSQFNVSAANIWNQARSAITDSGQVNSGPGGGIILIGQNGKRYAPLWVLLNSDESVILSMEDTNHIVITEAEFISDATAIGLYSGTITVEADIIVFPIPGTDRFHLTRSFGLDGQLFYGGICYEIDASGTPQPVYFWRYRCANLVGVPGQADKVLGIGISGEGTTSDPLYGVILDPFGENHVIKLPAYEELANPVLVDGTAGAWNAYKIDLNLGDGFSDGSADRGTFYQQEAFIVPTADVGVGITWGTKIIFVHDYYITNNPISSNTFNDAAQPSNPNGYLVEIDISAAFAITSGPTVKNDYFIDEAGDTFTYPFEDDRTGLDGVVDATFTQYMAPGVEKLPSSLATYAWIAMWPKRYLSDAVNQASGNAQAKVRAFIWNPFARTFTQYGSASGVHTNYGADNRQTMYLLPFFDGSNVGLLGEYGGTNNIFVSNFGSLVIGGQTDVTPAYIVYEILTNPIFGINLSASQINQSSYNDAVAYCIANNIFVSVQYVREDNVLQIIEQLLALFNCFLVVSGGTVRFGLQDFSISPVRTLDNHHFVVEKGKTPVKTIRAARQDAFNKVRVNYFDRALAYRQNQVEVSDEVDMDINGTRFKEFPAVFVMTEALANQIALRALWSNLYARDSYTFTIGPKDQDLEPGDPITLVDSFDPALSAGQRVRIGRISQRGPAEWDVVAVRELDYAQVSTLGAFAVSSPTGKGSVVGGIGPAFDFRAYELPSEFNLSDTQVFFGYNPSEKTAGARLYISPDGTTYGVAGDIQPFVINGIFASALPARPIGYVEQDVEVYLSPASAFDVGTPTYVQTYALDDVSEAGRAAGAGVLIAGSEALAMEGVTLLGQNRYRVARLYRGWGGTLPQAHSSGAYWHKHGGGVLGLSITTDKIGTQFYYKVQPYNFNGAGYNIASIDAKTWTIKDWPAVPQVINDLFTYAESANYGQVDPIYGPRGVNAGGSLLQFRWKPASRTTGFGTGGYGAGGFGRFTRDVTTPSYLFEVVSGNTVVRSTVVNTEAYDYDVDANSTDFNGWKGSFVARVTEFNGYGRAPYSAVQTLNIFN